MTDSLLMLISPFVIGLCVWSLVFGGIFSYYRNHDKRYAFEKETLVEVANAQGFDRQTRTRKGVKGNWMSDANHNKHHQRVRRIDMGGHSAGGG